MILCSSLVFFESSFSRTLCPCCHVAAKKVGLKRKPFSSFRTPANLVSFSTCLSQMVAIFPRYWRKLCYTAKAFIQLFKGKRNKRYIYRRREETGSKRGNRLYCKSFQVWSLANCWTVLCYSSPLPHLWDSVLSAIAAKRTETPSEKESIWLKVPFKEGEEQNGMESWAAAAFKKNCDNSSQLLVSMDFLD